MKYEIQGSDTFPIAVIALGEGETVQIESGAMLYHNGHIELQGKMNSNGKRGLGGLMSALGRSISSGETFFITTAVGTAADGQLAIAPGNPGPIKQLDVSGDNQWRLNTGAFLAADASAGYQMVAQKASRALFGGTGGFFIMETTGEGHVLVSAYGDLLAVDLDGSHEYVIDNNHVIAWQTSLEYQIEAASGVIGFTTGEGLVNRFSGTGRVYVQTRNIEALADMIQTYMPADSDNS